MTSWKETTTARPTFGPVSPRKRMAGYRQRMLAAGLRPVQIWVPNARSPDFAEACRRQALAVAADDPAGDDLLRFVAGAQDWPDA